VLKVEKYSSSPSGKVEICDDDTPRQKSTFLCLEQDVLGIVMTCWCH